MSDYHRQQCLKCGMHTQTVEMPELVIDVEGEHWTVSYPFYIRLVRMKDQAVAYLPIIAEHSVTQIVYPGASGRTDVPRDHPEAHVAPDKVPVWLLPNNKELYDISKYERCQKGIKTLCYSSVSDEEKKKARARKKKEEKTA